MSKSRIKIVLVGAGGWGGQHARILAEREDVEFAAISGRTEEKTRARANKYGVRYYLDIDEMLTKEKPDFVCACLPNKGHFEPTMQIIKAGLPLLVEKPITFDLGEADTLLAEAAKRNLFFAINFNHRYAKPVELARGAIAQGRLGAIRFATWRFGGEGGDCPQHENLIETQCHGLDMLEHLCGPIDSVAAQMTDNKSSVSVALHFQAGAVGGLMGSYESSYSYRDTHFVEINGKAGRVLIEDTVKRYTYQAAGNELAEVWEAGYFNDTDREFRRTFDRHMDAMLSAFRAGQQPPIHARAGRRALLLAQRIIESSKTGQRLAVPI